MLAGLAPGREAACRVGARGEASLHGCADTDVLDLDLLASIDTGDVAFSSSGGDIREVEVENDFRLRLAARNHQVRIHGGRIDIDHEVGIDPVIPRASAIRE